MMPPLSGEDTCVGEARRVEYFFTIELNSSEWKACGGIRAAPTRVMVLCMECDLGQKAAILPKNLMLADQRLESK